MSSSPLTKKSWENPFRTTNLPYYHDMSVTVCVQGYQDSVVIMKNVRDTRIFNSGNYFALQIPVNQQLIILKKRSTFKILGYTPLFDRLTRLGRLSEVSG